MNSKTIELGTTPKKYHDKKNTRASITKKILAIFLKKSCYPLLAGFAVLTIYATFSRGIDYGLANVSFLLFTIAYLALFERLIPYNRQWQATLKEWARDGAYLFITMLGGALSVAALFGLASVFAPSEPTLAMPLEIAIAIVVSSLGTYIFHRAGHDWPLLWRFHGIHHAEGKVNVGNNSVNHIFDVFGRRLLAQLPILFIGISEPALFIASIFNTMQGYFVHANIDVRMGFLNYLIGSPEQHRLHHSKRVEEAGHFCVDITLWDWVFKSYFWRPGLKPKGVGIKDPTKFPPPNSILKSFIHPFVSNKK